MTWVASTLWDLIGFRPRRKEVERIIKPSHSATVRVKSTMQDRYDAMVEQMKQAHGVRVRRWRKSSSGVAWTVRYIQSGKIVKLIESPYPRGPMSCAIFLHEIGHHAIGLGVYKPRCLEEYHAWAWALAKMRELGLNVTPAVQRRMDRSLQYAVAKARRRGIQSIPSELLPYV